ncbi:PREDICTED: MAP7 domain-containing protein 3 isoform X2 [Condylura cristata]|uniref:MAP7 domain-containing protein 3 isoform X2 n=1 Tax=Condylura cristata TaxID=143302 RepID=UPI000643D8C3|nr:PREDICTED: MAP7 domain-containing protein 3 isoform X2 [Condylura cristata]
MEEKQRKLKEQKEKDEQRRISAEEKRKQKLEEEREKFKAVLYRTMERSNRVDRQKRWSWEGSTVPVNSENKAEKMDKTRSPSLNRRYSKQNPSSEVEQVEEKPPGCHRYTNVRENILISRLLVPTKASIARSKSVASLSAPGKDVPGTHTTVIQYVNVPLRSHSSDELKAALMLRKSAPSVPPQEKVETPQEGSLEAPAEARVESPSKADTEALPMASKGTPLKASSKTAPRVDPEVLFEHYKMVPPDVSCGVLSTENVEEPSVSMATSSKANMEAFLQGNMEDLPGSSLQGLPKSQETSPEVSVDPSPEVSIDSSPEVSVDPSPEVSIDSSPDVSVDPSPEVSLDSSPDMSLEASSEASPDSSPKGSTSSSPKTSEEALLRECVRGSPEKSEMDKQASTPVIKRRPSPGISSYKWSSSLGLSPTSPVSPKQIQKTRPPSPSPSVSRRSPPSSLSYRVSPVQHTVFTPNVLGAIRKKKETVSKAPKRYESMNLKMSYEESGNKSAPGTLNAEEAMKILAEKRRLAREQKEKEEKLQEAHGRQEKLVTEPAAEDQEASQVGEGQQLKETKESGHDEDEQSGQHQKGDSKIRAQEEADKRKKEHERIMLQNLKERLERKKRIEEIMKRTRKTEWNASKSVETSGKSTYKVDKADEEDEADDEDESESEDSLRDSHSPAFVNSVHLSTKPKAHFKKARKKGPKLVFLDATSSQINETQACLNGDVKVFRQKSVKDPLAQAKGSRSSTKRMTNRTAKSRKTNKTSKTMGPSRSFHSQAQDWVHDKIVDIGSESEPRVSIIPPHSQKHNLEGSTLSHQKEVSLDVKKNKSVSAPPDM